MNDDIMRCYHCDYEDTEDMLLGHLIEGHAETVEQAENTLTYIRRDYLEASNEGC
jgi:hypothetical protein